MPESQLRYSPLRIGSYVVCALVPALAVIFLTNSKPSDISPDRATASESASGGEIPRADEPDLRKPTAIAPTTAPTTQPAVAQTPAPAPPLPLPTPATPATSAPGLDPTLALAVQSALSHGTFQMTPIVGGAFAKIPFQDVCPDGILIGFNIGVGKFFANDIVRSLQPIYLTPDGEKLGKRYGKTPDRTLRVTGPQGYAVGAATIRGGGGLDAVTLSFFRIKGNRLDTQDGYASPRIGGPGGGEASYGGDGTPVIGICGRYNDENEWLGLGLIFLKPTPAAKAH